MLEKVGTLTGHNEAVWAVSWSPDGKTLASCGADRAVRLWREGGPGAGWISAGELSGEQRRTVRSVSWSPDGRFLASASFDSTILLWERPGEEGGEWQRAGTLEGHENEVKRAAWSPSGRFLATASRDKSVWLWEGILASHLDDFFALGHQMGIAVDEEDEFSCCSILQNHSQDVKHVAWHPKTDILFSCSYDNSFRSYSFDGDDWVETFAAENAHETTIWCLSLNGEGDSLITACQDGTMKIWEARPRDVGPEKVKSWECLGRAESGCHDGPIFYVDWCGLSGLVATGCRDNGVRIFQPSKGPAGEPSFSLVASETESHSEDVNCVSWNPKQEGLLASASDDGLVILWKMDASAV